MITALVNCNQYQILFMNRCFCMPGYESKVQSSNDVNFIHCSEPILKIDDCICKADDRSFIFNYSISALQFRKEGDNYRCESLCRSNSEVGVPFSSPLEWRDNQNWLQLGFYTKELPQGTHNNHLHGRLHELAEGFSNFHFLEGFDMGNVIEFGSGGYTQTRNIIERVNVSLSHITLVDPLIYSYQKLRRCPYSTGNLIVNNTIYSTTLRDSTVELFDTDQLFDTVIVMNVILYAQNAFKFLEKIHSVLKPNGLLIFHDRWFEDIAWSSVCKMADFYRNPIQISRFVLDHFLSHFTHEPYFNSNKTSGQIFRNMNWCFGRDNEQAYFMVGRKI